eukprot:151355-Rhodomonas_salina.2
MSKSTECMRLSGFAGRDGELLEVLKSREINNRNGTIRQCPSSFCTHSARGQCLCTVPRQPQPTSEGHRLGGSCNVSRCRMPGQMIRRKAVWRARGAERRGVSASKEGKEGKVKRMRRREREQAERASR